MTFFALGVTHLVNTLEFNMNGGIQVNLLSISSENRNTVTLSSGNSFILGCNTVLYTWQSIYSQELNKPIIPELFFILWATYYSFFNPGTISSSLVHTKLQIDSRITNPKMWQ